MAVASKKRVEAFRNGILQWFEVYGRDFPWRKVDASTYAKVIAEVLLQRTTATAVAKLLPKFIEQFPNWQAIARADLSELQEAIRPLGLWRRRSQRLQRLADVMVSRDGEFPDTREAVESLPAIGQYIASAVLMICHDDGQPLLDTNMSRVLERYFGPREMVDIRDDPYLQNLSRAVIDHPDPEKVNWAVLDFGALVCKPLNPKCEECPVREGCRYWRSRGSLDSSRTE